MGDDSSEEPYDPQIRKVDVWRGFCEPNKLKRSWHNFSFKLPAHRDNRQLSLCGSRPHQRVPYISEDLGLLCLAISVPGSSGEVDIED